MVTPLLQSDSSNVVKVLHIGFSDSEHLQADTRLYIITELFFDSIHDLVSVNQFLRFHKSQRTIMFLNVLIQQELGPLEEDLIAWILREVLKGLDYLHSQGIAYGNMTTHHILFSFASGGLEVKLAHSHPVIDEMDVGAVSSRQKTNLNHRLKVSLLFIEGFLDEFACTVGRYLVSWHHCY